MSIRSQSVSDCFERVRMDEGALKDKKHQYPAWTPGIGNTGCFYLEKTELLFWHCMAFEGKDFIPNTTQLDGSMLPELDKL